MRHTRALVVRTQAAVRRFVRAAVSKQFPWASCRVDRHLPLASRSWETSSHRGDELAQLPDQDRLEVDLTLGCFPVGAFERRLQA